MAKSGMGQQGRAAAMLLAQTVRGGAGVGVVVPFDPGFGLRSRSDPASDGGGETGASVSSASPGGASASVAEAAGDVVGVDVVAGPRPVLGVDVADERAVAVGAASGPVLDEDGDPLPLGVSAAAASAWRRTVIEAALRREREELLALRVRVRDLEAEVAWLRGRLDDAREEGARAERAVVVRTMNGRLPSILAG